METRKNELDDFLQKKNRSVLLQSILFDPSRGNLIMILAARRFRDSLLPWKRPLGNIQQMKNIYCALEGLEKYVMMMFDMMQMLRTFMMMLIQVQDLFLSGRLTSLFR